MCELNGLLLLRHCKETHDKGKDIERINVSGEENIIRTSDFTLVIQDRVRVTHCKLQIKFFADTK